MRAILLLIAILLSNLQIVNAQESIVTIGTGTVNSQCPATPSAESYCQTIYEAAQVGTAGYINRLTYKRNDALAYTNALHWVVYLGNSNITGFYSSNADQIPLANLTKVFDGTIEVTATDVIVNLDTPFYYNGTSKLAIAVNEVSYGKHYAYLKATNFNNGSAYSPSKTFKNYSTASSVNAANPSTCDQISALAYQPNIDITFTTCLWPSSISATNPTQNTVQLDWINGLNENTWEIEAVKSGDAQGTGIVQITTTKPYVFTGLNHSTVYDFYIRASCGSNEYSKWEGLATSTTLCGAYNCFAEDFNSYAHLEKPRCFTNINNYGGLAVGTPGSLVLGMGGGAVVYQTVLPEFQAINGGVLSFKGYSAFNQYNTIDYGTMSDPTDVSTYTNIGTVTLSTSTQTFNLDFSSYSGTDKYISLKYTSAGLNTKVYLDDFNFYASGFCVFNTLYVNKYATGNNDGTSWANAYNTLQAALNNGSTKDIWIAQGTYIPDMTDRSIPFTINTTGIKLYGGFNGTETQLSDRVLGTNETILSGDLLGNDDNNITYSNTTRNDNSYTVLNILGDDIQLDGLTITGGHANGASGSATEARYGGGIHKNPATRNLTVTNCKLTRNFSKEAGGAISSGFSATGSTGTFTITNCEFSENLSAIGGVLYTANTGTLALSFSVSNSIFSKNKTLDTSAPATGYAGSSMWLRSYGAGSSIISNLTNCTFVDNIDTGTASGMSNTNRTTLTLTKNTNASHTATISNCIFWNNKTASGVIARPIGGFIESMISSATIKNSIDETNFTGVTLSGSSANTSNANPLFTNLASGDYTLSTGSPAIDNGDNTSVVGTTDLLGNQRIFNTTVDLGAYEFDAVLSNGSFTTFKEFTVYPNPTSGILNINLDEEIEKIDVYSLLGRKVGTSINTQMDISNLANGIYLLSIETKNGKIGTKRIVKQ